MKKNITFYDLILKKRLLGLLFLLFLCNENYAQTFCRPLSNTNSISGICIGSSVTNPTLAYDSAGLTTFANLSSVVGLFCSAQETLVLNQTAKAGDQIVLYLGSGNGLLDLSLLSTGAVQPKLNGVNAGAAVAINDPLLNLTLLPGNTIGVFRYTLTADANQVQIQLGGAVSVLTDLRIYDVRLEFAAPSVAGGLSQTICSGNATTLTATPAAGTTVTWYDSPTSSTPGTTGNTFTTPTLTSNTTYYIGVTRATGCEGNERVPVVINVSNPVAPAINTSGTAICATSSTQSTTLSVINPIPGTTYNWYNTSSGGTALASGDTYSPVVPIGTTSFYVEAVIGSCKSPARTQVDIVSVAVPSLPTILTQSVTIQSGQNATLNATTSQAGVTINWYDVATGGTALATNTMTFTTPILTATKTFYVETQSATGGCVSSSRVPVTVNVVTSVGGCLVASSQQTTINGICLLCSSTNPNDSVDGDITTAARLTVPVGLANGWIQQTLQFSNAGKAGDIVDVELELPGGLTDVQLLAAVSLATFNGSTYNNDRVLINNTGLVTLQLLSGNRFKASIVAGANFDRVEIRLGGLANVLTSLDIYQASYRYKAPIISGNTAICSGQSTTLTADINVGEIINWYNVPTNGASLSSTTSYTTPALSAPTTYYIEISRNGCLNSARFPVSVSISNPPVPVITAGGRTICSGQTTTLSVDSPVTGTVYNWYDESAGGNLLHTGETFSTPNLTNNITYHVEAVIGSCPSASRAPVAVTVNPLPTAPVAASSDVVIQSGQTATLQVSSTESNVTFDWYSVPTGGTVLANGTATYTTPALTNNMIYYVGARNLTSGCNSSTRTAINVRIINSTSFQCLKANSDSPNIIQPCVLCNIENSYLSSDLPSDTFARLTIGVGVGTGYVEELLGFLSTGQVGDIIDVELALPGGIADVSLLGNVSLATYNGTTFNNDRVFLNNSLLSLQLLSGNRFKASFVASAAFNKVEIRLGGVVTLLTDLDVYEASYRFKNATVTGAENPICSGQTATLTATPTVAGETFTWYDAAGGPLASGVTYTTPGLTASTTYYLEATRGVNCTNSVRQPVTVIVNPYAVAADVTIPDALNASCAGQVLLSPTSSLVGAQFRYYTTATKSEEITGSTVASQPGLTFSKDLSSGVLTINGFNAATTPKTYYVSVSNTTTCENDATTLKPVTVTFPVTPLAVTSPLVGCGTVNLKDAITGFDAAANTYTFYDPSNNVITPAAVANITTSGVYSIQAQGNSGQCQSTKLAVTVTINALPTLVITPPASSFNVGDDVALNAVSDGTVKWYNPQGVLLAGNQTGPLTAPGIYTYTAIATNTNCSRTGTVSINVIDTSKCQSLAQRVYADTQSWSSVITGGVSNGANAVDGNPKTFSTIVTGVGLLGVGTTWQYLQWTNPSNTLPIPAGTPVTVKLGSEYSGVALGAGLTVVGTKRNGAGTPIDIGTLQPISGSLLNLLPGDNTFEFTFVPSNSSGPQPYDGIRVVSGSVLSVAQNTKVFDAYYNKSVSSVTCTPGDIQDVFYGVTDLGIGALTSTVGVSDPYNVADNDVTTYATMYSGAGVLAAADLTVQFKTPSIATDTLRVVISKPGALLSVNALTGFTIQRYLGNVAVGAPIDNSGTFLSVKLLSANSLAVVLVSNQPETYDRVRIRFGGVAGVLDFLRVHTVERVANTKIIGSDPNNKITVCPGTDITLQIPQEACSTYVWYDAPTGGNVVASGITYKIPLTAAGGIYKYYIQPVRYGCESFARGEVTVEVRGTSPENALTDITLNGATSTAICSPSGTVTLATSLSGTPALTNPIYYWYRFDGTTSQLITGQTTSSLAVTGLTPGTYTYFVGVSSTETCETSAKDRKQITFTILRPSIADDIQVSDVIVCHDVPASLTPTASLLTNPIFYWYLGANRTQPIINGSVINGITYAVSATGVLTATGLTRAMTPLSYYVAVSSDTTCENEPGTLQTAAIIVNDPNTPTTTDDTQDFCLVDKPTVANIQVNEANVVWYNAQTGGTLLDPTTPLTSGAYFAVIKDPGTGCESSVSLQVTIKVNDPGTPTLVNAGTQNFCLINAPTFASVQFNQTNVVWYDTVSGGNLIPSTNTLTSGTYFASLKDATSGCESAKRLSVTINVTDPGTPTLVTAGTQNFCLVNKPTFASVQFNEMNIVWYDAVTGGNLIPSTNTLTSGTYFAAIKDATTGCESTTRLSVTISVTDPGTPTLVNGGTQNFCLINAPTFASVQFNQTNIVWYDAVTGGNLIPSTNTLTSGTYFAALKDATTGCESASRLLVTINVTDPGTPTLVNAGTQNFCLVNAPTFASVQFNQTNIVWYDAVSGGNLIPSTNTLTSGTYFVSLKDAITGCESASRLSVTISVTDPGTPTLVNAGTQNFCLVNAPTFASVQFNQSNIVWYDAISGGNLIPSTNTLTSGTYFAALKDATTGCESTTRLSVTISVTDPGTPTLVNAGTQNFCLINAPTFASVQFNQTNIVWYDAVTGGNLIPSTNTLTSGTYFAALKDATTGCESTTRLSVTISVTDPGTPTLVNAGTQNFCLVNAPTFASVQFNQTNIVWYDAVSGGNLIPSTNTLTSGTYFAALKDATTGCESASRLSVTISVTDPGTPTLVNAGTQNFCLVNAPTFASVQFNQSNIVWYDAISGGNLIPSTNTLTSGTYFAALKDATTGCESTTRLSVTISVTDPGTPTLVNAGTQNFCLINAPTFASVQFNQTNIVWYDAVTGGNLIPSTNTLTSGTYFAALKDATTGCESASRLSVTISVTDPGTPTLVTAGTQNFCSASAPTFASIQVKESNVSWFNSALGGTAIPSTTPLTSGTYFGEISDPVTGCKSATRLQVTININNPVPTPTTNSLTQNFCSLNAPTVANIQVNEANVIWYTTATGGTALPATTALITGTYYGVVSSTVACENPVRLVIAVRVNTPGVITTPRTTQTFCPAALATLANILVNETNVVWYSSATSTTPLAANTVLSATTYYAGALNNTTNGCASATRLGVTVNFENDALVQLVTTDDTPCVFQGVTYSIANGKSNYVWSVTNGKIISGGGNADGSVTISWSDIGPGKVEVTYINNCNETTTKSLNVTVATCSDLTITNTVSNPTPNFGEEITFTVTVNNVGEGNFINTIVSDLLPSGFDMVSSNTSAGTYDPVTHFWTIPTLNAGQSVTLTIVAEVVPGGEYVSVASVDVSTPLDVNAANNTASVTVEPICLTVYNEFTPNNDGQNDLFRIDCIESYPNNELKVYNRWGALVYSKQHYENDWNGTANVSGVINKGDMLPTGTYFYVIDIGNGTIKKGWLSIMR